jgi:phosphoribosylformylglycinamidine (FGAM) synthase-like enzyme
LVNQVERFIKPNEVYHKTFKVANSAHSRYKNKKLEMDTQEKLIEHLRAKGNVDPKKINDAEV